MKYLIYVRWCLSIFHFQDRKYLLTDNFALKLTFLLQKVQRYKLNTSFFKNAMVQNYFFSNSLPLFRIESKQKTFMLIVEFVVPKTNVCPDILRSLKFFFFLYSDSSSFQRPTKWELKKKSLPKKNRAEWRGRVPGKYSLKRHKKTLK